MINYTDEECIACKQKFTESDDIVVCPECGTPYHRSCWKENNGCINKTLHESGISWMKERTVSKTENSSVRKVCPACSFLNDENADVCGNCRTDLSEKECMKIDLADKNIVHIKLDSDEDYYGMNPMEIMDTDSGITIGEMGDYARTNKFYYMLVFRKLKKSTLKLSLNLLAFLFPEVYCASRKMFVHALVILIIRLLLMFPLYIEVVADLDSYMMPNMPYDKELFAELSSFAAAHSFSSKTVNFTTSLDNALKVAFGLFANELYFRHTVSKLKKLRKKMPDYLRYRNSIKTSGGISIIGVVLILFIQFVILMAMNMVMMYLAV